MTNPPMTYTQSSTTPIVIASPGSRLRSLVATAPDGSLDLVVQNAQLLGDPNRVSRMITLDFLATGGDNDFPLALGTSRSNLVEAAVTKNFTTPGAEQWALASYFSQIRVYPQIDTPAANDQRIQNLSVRTDTVSWPLLTRIDLGGASSVYFSTLAGKRYHVWAAEDLNGPWVQLTAEPGLEGTGFLVSYTDNAPADRKFYQILRED